MAICALFVAVAAGFNIGGATYELSCWLLVVAVSFVSIFSAKRLNPTRSFGPNIMSTAIMIMNPITPITILCTAFLSKLLLRRDVAIDDIPILYHIINNLQ